MGFDFDIYLFRSLLQKELHQSNTTTTIFFYLRVDPGDKHTSNVQEGYKHTQKRPINPQEDVGSLHGQSFGVQIS